MDLRLERATDRAAVRDVHTEAFGDHGSTVAALVDELRALLKPDSGLSLVAVQANVVVGHVMFTPSLLDAPRRLVTVQVLSPLAVLPQHAGQGIGSALVRAGVDLVRQQSTPAVFLEGSPTYYRRFGFRPAETLGFRRPSLRIPEEAFQVLCFTAHEPWMTGTLVYPQAFWNHDAVGLREDVEPQPPHPRTTP